jgi:hypothetical protein
MTRLAALASAILLSCGAPAEVDVAELEQAPAAAEWRLNPQGNQTSGQGNGSGACIELGTGMVYYDETSSSDGRCCRSNGVYYTLHEQYWNPTVYYCY